MFVFWAIGQTIVTVARIFKFDMTCASVKKKNPALYRHLKNEEARIMNSGRSTYWIIHHHDRQYKSTSTGILPQ
jgi:hypothetical protein